MNNEQKSNEQKKAWLLRARGTACAADALREALERECAVSAEAVEAIREVSDPTLRALLYRRYILGQTWSGIANALGYSFRHVQRLHELSLEKLCVPFGKS